MDRDIENWRDLTDEELKDVFANFAAINALEGAFTTDEASLAYGIFSSWLEHFSDIEKLKLAMIMVKQRKLRKKDFFEHFD